jgi:peptidoglycan-associated lipoprotein
MKKNHFSAAALLLLLAACASSPDNKQAPSAVEDRTPGAASTATPSGSTAQPRPVGPDAVQANPLKDPNNVLSKRSIFYAYDSDAIKDEYRPMLQAHANYLSGHKGTRMLVQGNCDERGSREYNIALGQRRAESVKRMLVLMGAAESQVEPVSLGEEKPRCTTDKSESCYGENRRSDLLYSGEY